MSKSLTQAGIPLHAEKPKYQHLGAVVVFGVTGSLGRTFLESCVHWLSQSREFVDAQQHRHFLMPWKKLIVAVSSGYDDPEVVRSLVDEFQCEEIDFIHYNATRSDQVHLLAANAVYALIIPTASEQRIKEYRTIVEGLNGLRNLKTVILVSSMACNEGQSEWLKEYNMMEQLIKKQRFKWIVVQCSPFMEYLLPFGTDIKQGVLDLPIGDGKFAPISITDVGKYLVKLLSDIEYTMSNISHELAGRELLSGHEISQIASKIMEQDVRFNGTVSLDEIQKRLTRRTVPEKLARGLVDIFSLIGQNRFDWTLVNPAYDDTLLTETVSIEEFFMMHLSKFQRQEKHDRPGVYLADEGIQNLFDICESFVDSIETQRDCQEAKKLISKFSSTMGEVLGNPCQLSRVHHALEHLCTLLAEREYSHQFQPSIVSQQPPYKDKSETLRSISSVKSFVTTSTVAI